MNLNNIHITVVGLGYVGLPLAVEFGKRYPTTGSDINQQRIEELKEGFDSTRELTKEQIKEATFLAFNSQLNQPTPDNQQPIGVYIITVPTPINQFKKPDLSFLLYASKSVGKVIKQGDIVIYESTVYPGCTEEDCVPVLERESGLKFNIDFFCAYSPERINPGDNERSLTNILKITSGSTPEIANFVDDLYKSIITAGTYKAPSIKIAEAAKVIENTQRYVNISLVNEFAQLFDVLEIDIKEVLAAASTKWNFHSYYPGLIGGPCLESASAYLAFKAEKNGFEPKIIQASQQRNDELLFFVASKFKKKKIAA